jgi:hypothetical protein
MPDLHACNTKFLIGPAHQNTCFRHTHGRIHTQNTHTRAQRHTLYNDPAIVMMSSVFGSVPKPTIDRVPSSCVSRN